MNLSFPRQLQMTFFATATLLLASCSGDLAEPAFAESAAWIKTARQVAADGIVLLKNDRAALPLPVGSSVRFFGSKDYLRCGGGSSEVRCAYEVSVPEGLLSVGYRQVAEGPAEAGVVLITRRSGEGWDPADKAFDLAPEELAAIDDAARATKRVVVVLNVGHLINLKPLKENPSVSAILLAWLPGMEGGNAIADIVSGKVNPSGRLVDTWAEKVADYPSNRSFRAEPLKVVYDEGTDVGYRYFNRKAKERIVYPFGYGLSYTTFDEANEKVTNTGKVAGRHTVLRFKDGELVAFGKTRLLQPGETEVVTLSTVHATSPRHDADPAENAAIDAILAKLTLEEKLNLCSAQPPAVPRGTAGLGNLPRYGLPNAQTADGPNGVRRSGNSVCHPVGVLLAQTFDTALAEAMGRALGEEAEKWNVDILLGPGLNIHRHPLCGRNFEYFSEDPLVSGKMAAAIVRGIQSTGTAATLKHFCCNNREWWRMDATSDVDEKTLRAIYLKGFEIAVKEGRPRCVMTSYNLLNGVYTAENENLIKGILRGEWGYDGLVMTDWRSKTEIWKQIAAGCDIYMPFGYPEKVALALEKAKSGELKMADIDASVRRVIREVRRSRRFKNGDFGFLTKVVPSGETVVKAERSNAVSSTWSNHLVDPVEGWCHSELGKDRRGSDTFVEYELEVERAGEYEIVLRAKTLNEKAAVSVEVAGKELKFPPFAAKDAWQNLGPVRVHLPAGRLTLRLWFRDGLPFVDTDYPGAIFSHFTICKGACSGRNENLASWLE